MKPTERTLLPVKPYRHGVYNAILALTLSVAWPAWADAPFTVNGNGTVTDVSTSLVWDQCPYGLSGSTCAAGTAFLGTWPQALAAAVSANVVSYKGFTDWRVPNVKELESITKLDAYTPGQPVIDTTAFPNTPITGGGLVGGSGETWTSTTWWGTVWVVDFGFGDISRTDTFYYNHVRLVRSGQSLASFDLLDTTAPVTTAGPTISSGPTQTTAGISVTIDEAGTGYWLLMPSAATPPTPAQVVAGVDYGAGTPVGSGNSAMTAATPASISLSAMTASTAYKLYFAAKDTSNNLQAAVSSVAVTTIAVADTTPPVTTAGPTISSGPTQTTAGISVTINEAGTGYWLLVPSAAAAPTPAQVVAGVSYGGVTITGSGNTAMTAATPASISLSSLTASTTYTLYFVAKDTANNLQAAAASVAVNTLAALSKSYTAASPTGTGSITAAFTGGGGGCAYATSQFSNATPPTGVTFTHGVFSFSTTDCGAGASLNFTITYPYLPAGTKYYKFGPTLGDPSNHWHVLDSASVSGNQITFSIADGSLDDSNGLPGFITDPGGPGVPAVAGGTTSIPTLSEWGVILLSGLLALLGLGRLRRQDRRAV